MGDFLIKNIPSAAELVKADTSNFDGAFTGLTTAQEIFDYLDDNLDASANKDATIGLYDAAWSYGVGSFCFYNSKIYYSLISTNLGNQPDLSPTQWRDYLEVEFIASLPVTGIANRIYVRNTDWTMHAWNGASYESLGGGGSGTGDMTKAVYDTDDDGIVDAAESINDGSTIDLSAVNLNDAYTHSTTISGNPHSVTKADVGLDQVDNTSDLNKPISTATQTALDGKASSTSVDNIFATGEPTGFPNLTDSTMSFNDGTNTFTIEPTGASFDIYQAGVKYTISTPQSITISLDEGLHHFYFDGGVINETLTLTEDIIRNKVYVANAYWDSINSVHIILGDERHGFRMDGDTHVYLHNVNGSQYVSGGALGNITADGDGSLDAHAQYSISSGIFFDEDIEFNLAGNIIGDTLDVYYRIGSDWRTDTQTNFGILNAPAGRIYYNLDTAGTWSLQEATDNHYVLYHVLMSNDFSRKYIVVMGLTEYPSIISASQGAATEIRELKDNGLAFQEFVNIATLIYQTNDLYTNAVKAIIRSRADDSEYVDWREQKITTTDIQNQAITYYKLESMLRYIQQPVFTGLSYYAGQFVADGTGVHYPDFTITISSNNREVNPDDLIEVSFTDGSIAYPASDGIFHLIAKSDGSLVWIDRVVDGAHDWDTEVFIAYAYIESSTLIESRILPVFSNTNPTMRTDRRVTRPIPNVTYGRKGVTAEITISTFDILIEGIDFNDDQKNPSLKRYLAQDPMSFRYTDSNGSLLGADTTLINDAVYDDSGTLVATKNNYGYIQVILSTIGGQKFILHSQEEYATTSDALAGVDTYNPTIPATTLASTFPIGAMIIRGLSLGDTDGIQFIPIPAQVMAQYNVQYSSYGGGVASYGDMYKSVYDINDNGIVDKAEQLDDGLGNTLTPVHTHSIKQITNDIAEPILVYQSLIFGEDGYIYGTPYLQDGRLLIITEDFTMTTKVQVFAKYVVDNSLNPITITFPTKAILDGWIPEGTRNRITLDIELDTYNPANKIEFGIDGDVFYELTPDNVPFKFDFENRIGGDNDIDVIPYIEPLAPQNPNQTLVTNDLHGVTYTNYAFSFLSDAFQLDADNANHIVTVNAQGDKLIPLPAGENNYIYHFRDVANQLIAVNNTATINWNTVGFDDGGFTDYTFNGTTYTITNNFSSLLIDVLINVQAVGVTSNKILTVKYKIMLNDVEQTQYTIIQNYIDTNARFITLEADLQNIVTSDEIRIEIETSGANGTAIDILNNVNSYFGVVYATGAAIGADVYWGTILGTLSNQTDLQNALDTKLEDAPSDGNTYGRNNGAWVVTGGGLDGAADELITGNWTFDGNADIYSNQLTSKPDIGDEYLRIARVRIEGTSVFARSNLRFNIGHTGTFIKYGKVESFIYKISGNDSLQVSSYVNILNNSMSSFNFASGDIVYQNWIPDSGNIGFTDIYIKVQEYAKVHMNLDYGFNENGATTIIDPDGGTRIAAIPINGATDTIEGIAVTAETAVNADVINIGIGNMLTSIYDPTSVSGDAFAMDNMVEGTTTKVMTDAERVKLTGIENGAEANNISDANATTLTDGSNADALHTHLEVTDSNATTGLGQLKLYTCTQTEYDAIGTKDTSTLYFIR